MVVSMDRWVGKVAVVTGASSGIGAGIAKKLVEEGLKVVGLARRTERVQELAQSLSKEKGVLHPLFCDVSSTESIVKAFQEIEKKYGGISILINNAGVVAHTTLIDGDVDKWKNILDINVLGLCTATREAISSMKKHNIDGHIIHINSVLGHQVYPIPGMNVYPASKFAVTALADTLRAELTSLGSNIKITSVSPGLVKSEFQVAANLPAETIRGLEQMSRLEPEDIADACVYALSTPPSVQISELMIRPVGEGR